MFEVSRGPLSIDSNIKKKVSNLSSLIFVTIELLKRKKGKRRRRRESMFVTLIYQMIMTFNVVSNFALSQISNCKYNDIHWFTTRSSHWIWGTIFVWIFFSSNYLLTEFRKLIWFSCNYFLTRIWKIGVGVYIKLKDSGPKFPSSTLQDDKFQPIHWSLQMQSMIYG